MSPGHSRALVRRAIRDHGSQSFESCSTEVPGRRRSLQQRQWYLFQRAALPEALKEIAKRSRVDKGASRGSEEGFDRDIKGAVQRLIASWWHDHKDSLLSETSGKNTSDAVSTTLCGSTLKTAAQQQSDFSTGPERECQLTTGAQSRQSLCKYDLGNAAECREICTSESDTDRRSARRGDHAANNCSRKVGSRFSSVEEAEQYARTVLHVWKRFGARAWEAELTNDEAAALYRAWA
jgi:hypothetical protein